MGYSKPHLSLISLGCTAGDLNDSTTYYMSNAQSYALTTSFARIKLYSPYKCTIRGAILYAYHSVDCSAENTAISIRVNDTTDYSVYTGTFAIGTKTNYALNVPLSAGDYFVIKIVTPAWVTNPTGTTVYGFLLIEI